MSKVTIRDRFFAKVEKTESCWVWTGSRLRGYGQFWLNGKLHIAHRVSWVLHVGPIAFGLHALHKCDNPSCVNPDHLFLGTAKTNVHDMMDKGRHRNQHTINRLGPVQSRP